MTHRGAVVIGVDRAGDELRLLRAAASDAATIRDWLADEGFEVVLLTDMVEGSRGAGRVQLSEIKGAVTTFCNYGTLEQLIVYFAGHGVHRIGSEIWLLSGAPDDPGEAINLDKNVDFARICGIPNVVFISDACRLLSDDQRLAAVEGSIAFPNPRTGNRRRGRVDRLLPTEPNKAAYEVDMGGMGRRAGIFTDELLAAHGFPSKRVPRYDNVETSLVRLRKTVAGTERVIDLASLATYLEARVPIVAAERAVEGLQQPECIVETPPTDKFIGRALFAKTVFPETKEEAELAIERRRFPPSAPYGFELTHSPFAAGLMADLDSSRRAIRTADCRRLVGTPTGIQLTGDRIEWAAALSSGPLPHRPDSVSVWTATPIETVLLQLRSGNGVVVAVFAGYVASLKILGGRLMNVSYLPSEPRPPGEAGADLESLRADVAAKARHGAFRIASGEASRFADRIRTMKGVDPTLGLYAAYAYQSAGRRGQINSVLRYMRRDLGGFAPFDVVLLAGIPRAEAETRGMSDLPDYRTGLKGAAPFCPMLTQGWSFLRTRLKSMPPRLEILMRHLVPALWTTFDGEAVEILQRDLARGDLT